MAYVKDGAVERIEQAHQVLLEHAFQARITPKAQVREVATGLGSIAQVEFSYDEAGLAAAVEEALAWEGIYFVKAWLNEGVCAVGDSLMYAMIGGDIRPHVIDALQNLVGKIKTELVVEKEIFA